MNRNRITDDKKPALRQKLFLIAAALQIGCGIVFAADVFVERNELGLHILAELLAVIALVIGATVSIGQYRQIICRNAKIERELDLASGAFQEVIEHYFQMWGLTAAERDVALLSIKGVSISDIAALRQSREGTVKAQNAAIYRKSGVSSRAELLSVMVEELLEGLHPAGSHPTSGLNQ